MDKEIRNSDNAAEKSVKKRARKSYMTPLISAAKRVSKLICELSADKELFVSEPGQRSERKLDTKALKEFSGVIKEMSAVMSELDPDRAVRPEAEITIAFENGADELSE